MPSAALLPHIHHGLDEAVAIICQQFESLGPLVQAESGRDYKIRLVPAFADQVDYGIDTLILAPDA
jgi:hypothetical protein